MGVFLATADPLSSFFHNLEIGGRGSATTLQLSMGGCFFRSRWDAGSVFDGFLLPLPCLLSIGEMSLRSFGLVVSMVSKSPGRPRAFIP